MLSRVLSQSRRLAAVQVPVIPIVARWIAETPGTISLGQGVVSYGPPPEAVAASQRFGASLSDHRYGPVEGLPALVAALEAKLAAENGITVRPGSRRAGDRRRQPGVLECSPGHHGSGGRDHPAGAVLLQPRDGHRDGRGDARSRSRPTATISWTCRRSSGRSRRARAPSSRCRRTIRPAPSTRRRRSPRSTALCRARGIFHMHDEAYEYFTYGTCAPFSPGSIAGARRPHDLAVFAVEGLRDGELADRLHGDPGVAARSGEQGPGHAADLPAGGVAARRAGGAGGRPGARRGALVARSTRPAG